MKKQSYILAVGLVCACLLAPAMAQAQTVAPDNSLHTKLADKLTSADNDKICEKVQAANKRLAEAKTTAETSLIVQQFLDSLLIHSVSIWANNNPTNRSQEIIFNAGSSSNEMSSVTINGTIFFIKTNNLEDIARDISAKAKTKARIENVIAEAKARAENISKEKHIKNLQTNSPSSRIHKDYDYSPVDLSGVTDIKEKLAKILERFNESEGYTYSHDNPLVKQMVGLGEDAVQPLLDMLAQEEKMLTQDKRMPGSNRERAMADALEYMLTEKHKEAILYYFKEKGLFSKQIRRYRFPEAEDIVMDKIAQGLGMKCCILLWRPDYDKDVIDTALMMNESRAIPLLIEYVKKSRGGLGIEHAAQRLAMIPGLDLKEMLKQAAANSYDYRVTTFAGLMLDKGMPEGFDYALVILDDKNYVGGQYFVKEKCAESITRNTGVMGSPEEMAEWVRTNKANLKWNPDIRKFEISGESSSKSEKAEGLFMKGMQMETADADYAGAIKVYEDILEKYKTDKAIADKATARINLCREKLGVKK